MIFLTDSDFTMLIRNEVMAVVTNGDAANKDKAELAAIEEMTSYLAGRFDTGLIFDDTDRNPLIIMYCIDILLYHLHSNINPRNIPELRKTRYDSAIEWLKRVAAGGLNPNLPVTEGEESQPYRLGSNIKKSRDW